MSRTIWAMYFSGTGTTETMTTHIAEGLAGKIGAEMKSFDFTKPGARKEPVVFSKDDIVILGTPVIAGRTPNLLLKYLDTIQGNGALGIPVVMYGCRAFDDSLVELRNIMEKDGFHTFAGAACAAEQSGSGSKITTLIPACLAANVNICPSCPPPMIPIVLPCSMSSDKLITAFCSLVVHLFTILGHFKLNSRICGSDNFQSQQSSVLGA